MADTQIIRSRRFHSNQKAQEPQQGYLDLGPSSLRGEIETVLVKFTFKNREFVPSGIPQVERQPDYRMDVLHQREAHKAGHGGLAHVGRVREGRVDTGGNVITTTRPAHSGVLRRGLANNGFHLVSLHWFTKTERDEPNYTVVACFGRVPEGMQYTPSIIEALRELANMSWGRCYVWDNPNQVATINFVGYLKGQSPKQAVAVRDGDIVAVDVPKAMDEDEEAEISATA